MRIIGYARVSSREQAENSHALEQQIARLKAAGANEILFDVATGSNDKRSKFVELLDLVKRDAIQEVIITRIDRLTRRLKTVLTIRDVFLASKVNLRALDDSIDLSTVAGKFHFSMLGSLAEMETDRLSERVRHGWSNMRENKRVAVAPFGYHIVDGKLELNNNVLLCLLDDQREYTYADIARITVELFMEAKTLRKTIRLFNEKYGIRRFSNGRGRKTWWQLGWSPNGLSTWLQNPTLLGHTRYPLKRGRTDNKSKADWEVYYDTHEPLISNDIANEIADVLNNNKQKRGYGTKHKRKHAIAGLVYCSRCQSSCYSLAATRGKTPGYNYYFQCRNWRTRSCDQNKTVRVEKINNAVIAALTNRAAILAEMSDNQMPTNTTDVSADIVLLQKQLEGLDKLGYNVAIEQSKREIARQIANLQQSANNNSSKVESKLDLLQTIFAIPDFWTSQSLDDQTSIYKALVKRVTIEAGEVADVELLI